VLYITVTVISSLFVAMKKDSDAFDRGITTLAMRGSW